MADTTFALTDTYLQLDDGPGTHRVWAAVEGFWERLADRPELDDGRLVTMIRYTDDWPTWEMHPAGDELVLLLDGAVDVVLDEDGGEQVVELRGRSACLVPAGVWHRAIVHEPGDVLHITRGAGTRHRSV